MAEFLATLVPVLGRALLHFVWQGAVIGLLAAIALQLLRNARPQLRYAVACLALLACVLLPLIGVALDLGGIAHAQAAMTATSATPGFGMPALTTVDIAAWPSRLEAALPLIVALWAGGASVLSLRMAMGVAWIRRLRATPQGPAQALWQARLDVLAQRFGLAPVALRMVDTMDSPASAGWWRPVVLLPSALVTRMPVDLIEALLAHELAHIRRHDYLVNLLQGVVEALLFYHPVTWWLSRRIRIEREHIADQLAASTTGAPRRLALALAELSELSELGSASARHRCPPPHLALAAHGGHLMSRIQQLVHPARRATGGKLAFPLLGLAAACIALYAQAQVSAPAPVPAPAAAPAAMPAPVAVQGPVLEPRDPVAQVTRLTTDRRRDAFALVRKDRHGITMSGSTDDIPAIEAARDQVGRDFVWVRRGDRTYVVDDPATVARAQEAWHEVDKLSPRMEALGARMEEHGDKLEVLGDRMKRLGQHHRPSPAMDAAARQMERLGGRQQELAGRQMRLAAAMIDADDARRDTLQAQMDTLGEQMEALSRQMEQHAGVLEAESAELQAMSAPMEALGRQMEEAGKPMEALGKQMEVLGKQQEVHVRQAERVLGKLIDTALEQGLAKPAPRPAGTH